MANYNHGSLHSLGYIRGSFWQGLCSIGLSILCFVLVFKMPTFLLSLVLLFAGFACIAFAVYSFAMFAQYKEFGSGAKSKIVHSKNLSPSTNRSYYNSTTTVSIVSGIVCFAFGITALVLLKIAHPWNSSILDGLIWVAMAVFAIIVALLIVLAIKSGRDRW